MNYSDTTASRLLAAGWSLFAKQGYDRTSVRAITRKAKANLGAVTYHFGTKERLYHAVLERLFGTMGRHLQGAVDDPSPTDAVRRVRRVVAAMFAFFREHPDAPRIVLQQITREATLPEAVTARMRTNLTLIAGVIAAGQVQGVFRPGNPLFGAFSIISQVVWFAVARRTISQVSNALSDPEVASGFERHIADLVTRGLAAHPEVP